LKTAVVVGYNHIRKCPSSSFLSISKAEFFSENHEGPLKKSIRGVGRNPNHQQRRGRATLMAFCLSTSTRTRAMVHKQKGIVQVLGRSGRWCFRNTLLTKLQKILQFLLSEFIPRRGVDVFEVVRDKELVNEIVEVAVVERVGKAAVVVLQIRILVLVTVFVGGHVGQHEPGMKGQHAPAQRTENAVIQQHDHVAGVVLHVPLLRAAHEVVELRVDEEVNGDIVKHNVAVKVRVVLAADAVGHEGAKMVEQDHALLRGAAMFRPQRPENVARVAHAAEHGRLRGVQRPGGSDVGQQLVVLLLVDSHFRNEAGIGPPAAHVKVRHEKVREDGKRPERPAEAHFRAVHEIRVQHPRESHVEKDGHQGDLAFNVYERRGKGKRKK
jgi:hypothetical protein